MNSLEVTLRDVSSYNDFLIGSLLERETFADSGRLCANICRYFRATGICELLLHADVDAFFHGLLRSALTWRWYLARARDEGVLEHPACKASFVAPFADALVASRADLAAQITELAPASWRLDYEYEDDFLFASVLRSLVLRPEAIDDGARVALLERWTEVLEGQEDLRLPICSALVARESDAFDESFFALAADREARFEARAAPEVDGVTAEDFDFVPNARIWVEGLAFLRLAEQRGLSLRGEYPTCPSLVRVTRYADLPVARFPPAVL